MKSKVMIIDSDNTVHSLIKEALQGNGYEFIQIYDNQSVLALIDQHEPILILLDLILSDVDGIELCQQIRKITNVPIIFISSKTEILSKAACFGAGGDDYIEKPFSPDDLSIRVRAKIRRYRELTGISSGHLPKGKREASLDYYPLKIDLDCHLVTINGEIIPMTAKEFKILAILAKNPRRFFTSDELMSLVWNDENSADNNSLISHISRIRKKLSVHPKVQNYIQTMRNVGYKFSPGDN